jgi:hypothetical protein
MSSVYYLNLMYGGLRISATLHEKRCHIGPGLCATSGGFSAAYPALYLR